MIYYGQELYHHGIKGQKWGQRRWQNEDGSYTSQGQAENNGHGRYSINTESNKQIINSKYIKIGLAITGTVLVGYGAYSLYKNRDYISEHIKNGSIKNDILQMKVGDAQIVDPTNYLKRNDISGKLAEALKDVNPSSEKDHCQQNVVAACMRYLGMDAQTKSGEWSTNAGSIVAKCFKGFDETKVRMPNVKFQTSEDASSWIIKRLKPINGSCGSISMGIKGGGGHAIMWCMEDGKIKYSDPFARTSNGYKIIEDASWYFGNVFTDSNPVISRLDNLEIDIENFDKYFTH